MLNHMRVIKLQAWEEKFGGKVRDIRKEELGWLAKIMLFMCGLFTISISEFYNPTHTHTPINTNYNRKHGSSFRGSQGKDWCHLR